MRAILLPSPTLDVASFVARSWPKTTISLISRKAQTCFLKTVASESGSCLKDRHLPSREFVNDALKCIDKAVGDGASSIIDPNYPAGRLPLWSLTFWRESHEVAEAWKTWSKSLFWLQKHGPSFPIQSELAESYRRLTSLPWKEATKVSAAATGMSTVDFARVLGDTMLTTTLVDVLVNIIMNHVQSSDTLSKTFEVADLVFMYYIEEAESPEHYQEKSSPYLRRLEKKLRGKEKILVYPMYNPERLHFISAEVDFKRKTISYGACDSDATISSAMAKHISCRRLAPSEQAKVSFRLGESAVVAVSSFRWSIRE